MGLIEALLEVATALALWVAVAEGTGEVAVRGAVAVCVVSGGAVASGGGGEYGTG